MQLAGILFGKRGFNSMRLHPTFRPFNAFMVFNCNWWGFYSRTLPNLCFFFAKFALVSTNLCQIPLKKGFLFSHFAKFAFFLGKRGFNCNWLVFYSEKVVFNRCDCIPTSSPFALLWYLIATGRGPIREKWFLIDVAAYQL